MRIVASYITLSTALFCLFHSAQSLQMILSTREPQCLTVEPRRIGVFINVSYSISGVNEQ